MRNIYPRFAPRELQAELQQGTISTHKEMPQIGFSDEDVNAILEALFHLAAKRLAERFGASSLP
jgi:cytochrome c